MDTIFTEIGLSDDKRMELFKAKLEKTIDDACLAVGNPQITLYKDLQYFRRGWGAKGFYAIAEAMEVLTDEKTKALCGEVCNLFVDYIVYKESLR